MPFLERLAGFALHHLTTEEKGEVFRQVSRSLRPGGVFLLVDVVRHEDESHDAHLQAACDWMRKEWHDFSPEEMATICRKPSSPWRGGPRPPGCPHPNRSTGPLAPHSGVRENARPRRSAQLVVQTQHDLHDDQEDDVPLDPQRLAVVHQIEIGLGGARDKFELA